MNIHSIKNIIHHFFIPKEENNFRAKAIHIDSLSVYLLLILFVSIFFRPFSPVHGNVLGIATDISIPKLFELTNQERQKNGLSALTYNDKLASAAENKAKDMFAKNYWAHFAPDGTTTPWSFIRGSGYDYEYAGENLAKNFLFSNGVVDAWMNSPSHRENLLRKEYSEVGFAVANGNLDGEPTTLVVQMFGKPLASTAAQPQVNQKVPVGVHENAQSILQNSKPAVLAETPNSQTTLLPLFFNLNIIFFALLMLALALDFYFAYKMKLIRISGKNIPHFLFLLFIIIGSYIAINGKTL